MRTTRSRLALAALAVLLAACSTPHPERGPGWRIEPLLAVRHSPAVSEAFYRMGRYYDGMQRWGDALDAYRRAAAADPANVEAWNALGVAHARMGQLAQAEALLRHALTLAPLRADLRSNLAEALALAGRGNEAVVDAPAKRIEPEPEPALAAASQPAPIPVVRDTPATTLQVIDTPTLAWSDRSPPTAPPGARPARLEIGNGMGATGAAQQLRRWLAGHGVATQRLSNVKPYVQPATVVQFLAGHEPAAQRLARLLPAGVRIEAATGLRADVRVLLGRDWTRLAACLDAGCPQPALQVARAAPATDVD